MSERCQEQDSDFTVTGRMFTASMCCQKLLELSDIITPVSMKGTFPTTWWTQAWIEVRQTGIIPPAAARCALKQTQALSLSVYCWVLSVCVCLPVHPHVKDEASTHFPTSSQAFSLIRENVLLSLFNVPFECVMLTCNMNHSCFVLHGNYAINSKSLRANSKCLECSTEAR